MSLINIHPINTAPVSNASSNSPWISTGCFISRHPVWFSAVMGILFWIYRSQVYSGDGDQLCRMVEAGVTFVQTELLSQFILQVAYQILRPFGWDGLSVINLVSCISGAVAVWVLLKFNRDFVGENPLWGMGFFASSGLFLLCTGHTEYYTLFLFTLLYYGYAGVGYLRGRVSSLHAALAFSFSVWMHMGIMFAFPSVILLPVLKRCWKDYYGIAYGLSFTVAAFLMKSHSQFLGIEVHGLSPSQNFIHLFEDPGGEQFYLMFQWGHMLDYIWAWTARSWIFWPVVGWAAVLFGVRGLFQKERLFLLIYTLGFTLFTFTWHPNLGIIQDWDLFAIEAVPCLLLVMTYLPELLQSRFRRVALVIPVIASMVLVYQQVMLEAHFGQRAYGSVRIELSEEIPNQVNLNGHLKELNNPAVREGVYEGRLRDIRHLRGYLFNLHVAPYAETTFFMRVGDK